MGAVTVGIVRGGIVLDEVPAMDVVHQAVAVIVDAVAGDLVRVGPDVGGEIGVVGVDTTVDHRNHDRGKCVGEIPGSGCVDALRAEEPPKRSGFGVVARRDVDGGVERHVTDRRMGLEGFLGLVEVGSRFEQVDVALTKAFDESGVGAFEQGVHVGGIGVRFEFDEECVGVVCNVGAVLEHDLCKLVGVATGSVERKTVVIRLLGYRGACGRSCRRKREGKCKRRRGKQGEPCSGGCPMLVHDGPRSSLPVPSTGGGRP